jgi:hypothetical protein
MPVFLALALISGQPLNLVPDDCPNLPPWYICRERLWQASQRLLQCEKEFAFRRNYDPHKDVDGTVGLWLKKNPNALRLWRKEAEDRLQETKVVCNFWAAAMCARRSVFWQEPPFPSRADAIRDCRRYLGEALWQKGGWWK